MLQTCDVRCCVEEEEGGWLLMLDVACNTGHNMSRLGIVPGGVRRATDVGCCTQHTRNMTPEHFVML
jgi:hypothetical protein